MKIIYSVNPPTPGSDPGIWKENGTLYLKVTGINKEDYDIMVAALNKVFPGNTLESRVTRVTK